MIEGRWKCSGILMEVVVQGARLRVVWAWGWRRVEAEASVRGAQRLPRCADCSVECYGFLCGLSGSSMATGTVSSGRNV
jgi:hypothetical protein